MTLIAYLPSSIKAPAPIASTSSKVRIVMGPPPIRLIRPIRMSQIPSKSIPIFFVIFTFISFTAFPWTNIIDLIVPLVAETSKSGRFCLTKKSELITKERQRLRPESGNILISFYPREQEIDALDNYYNNNPIYPPGNVTPEENNVNKWSNGCQ